MLTSLVRPPAVVDGGLRDIACEMTKLRCQTQITVNAELIAYQAAFSPH